MNLVEIRSHDTPKTAATSLEPQQSGGESKKANLLSEEVKGFALTVKDSFIETILDVCQQIRPLSFLDPSSQDEDRPFSCNGDVDQMLLIADETALICALDAKQILSWPDFEYVLSLVIENRMLRLY